MLFYQVQLKHAIATQGGNQLPSVAMQCCLMTFWTSFSLKAGERWEKDIGPFVEDQWEEALQAIQKCSLNATQRLMQLFIPLKAHYTPVKLHKYWAGVLQTINMVF